MGQKTHPIGVRLGIIKGWESNWYCGKQFGGKNNGKQYADLLFEDEQIRNYILKSYGLQSDKKGGGISKIVIERTQRKIIVTIHTAKPGIVIGKEGKDVENLKEQLKKLYNTEVLINIAEIKRPELEAKLVAEGIAQQLNARISFRRAMKTAISSAMRMQAEGIKIVCSGRLGGAEMARTERYKEGRVPLQTLRADIDYATATAHTIYGAIGIKVWIFKGEILGKVDLSPDAVAAKRYDRDRTGDSGSDRRGGGDRGGDRRGGGDRGGDRRGGDRRGGGQNRNRGR